MQTLLNTHLVCRHSSTPTSRHPSPCRSDGRQGAGAAHVPDAEQRAPKQSTDQCVPTGRRKLLSRVHWQGVSF